MISGCQSLGEGGMKRQSTGDFWTVEVLCMSLHWWTHIHLSKLTECTPGINPNASDDVSMQAHGL